MRTLTSVQDVVFVFSNYNLMNPTTYGTRKEFRCSVHYTQQPSAAITKKEEGKSKF
ncbi:hypothetical protein GLYMA_12G147800v4 [Glycine max]|uniref:Uncharacterized protein n=1 Tax=Glycine max TaxID=3847 RepID=K7LUZ2_SOYBN|nr:hypothetical protein GYH30_033772 [Glycine max]KRH26042.1 hypothetical protein GLYMA_12G147800v4 [Glycine max]